MRARSSSPAISSTRADRLGADGGGLCPLCPHPAPITIIERTRSLPRARRARRRRPPRLLGRQWNQIVASPRPLAQWVEGRRHPPLASLGASSYGGSTMICVLTILATVVALAVAAAPASAVSDGTSHRRPAAFRPP